MKKKFDFQLSYEEKEKRKKALDAEYEEYEGQEDWSEEDRKRYRQTEIVQELLEGIMNTRDSELAHDLTEEMTEEQVLELIDLLRRVNAQ